MKEIEFVYPDLSYKIIGIAFKIYNSLGYGHKEKYYQRAFERELTSTGLSFVKEKEVKLIYESDCIGKYRLDFVVEDKIIVELKARSVVRKVHIKQVLQYLNVIEKKLAILIYFTKQGVIYKRVINPEFD